MGNVEEFRLTRNDHVRALLLFALLAAVYMIPALKGVPAGDGYGNYHGFWWFKKALLSLRNPFYSDYFYFPQGANLAFYGGASFSSFLLTLPISLVAGIHAAILSAHFLGYLLSGYFTFLLAYELTGSKKGAVTAGLIFGFFPYHFVNVPVAMILSSLQWMPMFLWLFKRSVECLQARWAVLAGVALSLVILADQMQAIMVALIILGIFPFLLWQQAGSSGAEAGSAAQGIRRLLVNLFIMGATALVLSSPYLYAFFDFMTQSSGVLAISHFDYRGANSFSADLLSFFLPPTYHQIWGGTFPATMPFARGAAYLGYVPVILSGIALAGFWRRGLVKFLGILLAISLVLSLGPTLHINGVWQWGEKIIKLPYYFTNNWPIIGNIRTPYRFQPLTMICIALLAAYGVAHLEKMLSKYPWKNWLLAILSVCVIIEFLPGPNEYPVATKVPELIYSIAKDEKDYSVLQIPLSRWDSFARNGSSSPGQNIYFQSIHGKRIFTGHMSRAQPKTLEFNDSILELIKELSTFENYVVVGREKRVANLQELDEARALARSMAPLRDDFFHRNRIGYIIIHGPVSYKGSMCRAFIEEFTGMTLAEAPADGIAYLKLQ